MSSKPEPEPTSRNQLGQAPEQRMNLSSTVASRGDGELSADVSERLDELLVLSQSDPMAALGIIAEIENHALREELGFEFIGRLDVAQLRAIGIGFGDSASGSEERFVLNGVFESALIPMTLYARWVELDPEGITEFICSRPAPEDDANSFFPMRLFCRGFALAGLAESDPTQALQVFERLGEEGHWSNEEKLREMLSTFMAVGMSMDDPIVALRHIREQGLPISSLADSPIFQGSGSDPEAVLAELMAFPEGERNELVSGFHNQWAVKDIDAALASIQATAPEAIREEWMGRALRELAGVDAGAAIETLGSLEADGWRDGLTEDLLAVWREQDPEAALDWVGENHPEVAMGHRIEEVSEGLSADVAMLYLEEMPIAERVSFLEKTSLTEDHFLSRMAREDPQATLDWISKNGGFEVVGSFGKKMATAALASGVDSAMALVDQLPDGRFRDTFAQEIAAELAHERGADGMDWAREQGDEALSQALEAWGHSSPEDAVNFAKSEDQTLFQPVLDDWIRAAPEDAYRWIVEESVGDPEAIGVYLDGGFLIRQWVDADPLSAAEAMLGFPGDLIQKHLSEVVRNWVVQEPERATEFVTGRLEDGPVRDAAVAQLINGTKDRGEARALAESIEDQEIRDSILDQLNSSE